jgi:hypothetical protein
LSKYRHLGKAGSEAHLSAVRAVLRRSLIDEVQQTIYRYSFPKTHRVLMPRFPHQRTVPCQ